MLRILCSATREEKEMKVQENWRRRKTICIQKYYIWRKQKRIYEQTIKIKLFQQDHATQCQYSFYNQLYSYISSKKSENVFPKKSQVQHHQPHSLPGLQWGSSEATQSLSTAEVLRRGLPLLPFSPHQTGHSCGPWSFPEHSSALVQNCTCLLIQDTWYSRMNRWS